MDETFTFRMDSTGKPFYEDDQAGSGHSTAPSSPGQSISAMASATSTDISSQSSVSGGQTVRKALQDHFSAMETIAAKCSTTTPTEGEKDQAVTGQPMTLDEAERLLHAAGQVPLQGIEFLRYRARKPPPVVLSCLQTFLRQLDRTPKLAVQPRTLGARLQEGVRTRAGC